MRNVIKGPTSKSGWLTLVLMLSVQHLSANESTTVYKVVNPDGSISYSDAPTSDSKAIEIPPVTTIPAIEVRHNTPIEEAKKKKNNGYQKLLITEPKSGSSSHSGQGKVDIQIVSEPALQSGHLFQILVDGKEARTTTNPTTAIYDVERGTHGLTVNIIDRTSKVLKSSSTTFTMHRPIVVNNRPSLPNNRPPTIQPIPRTLPTQRN